MKIQPTEQWLPVYEALASRVRLRVIALLADHPRNIKELAKELGLSSAIMTMHIKKLEAAGIVSSSRVRSNGGIQKLCVLSAQTLEIDFPGQGIQPRKHHEVTMPVGHYTDYSVKPTCGLATIEKLIGFYDDPRYFLDPERVQARIIWFSQGYVEYKIPNYLLSSQTLEEVEISMELSSEAPGFNNHWPSDISFYINGIFLGQWTSPGDYGGKRGKYTPAWWSESINQYGLLKVLRINASGTYMDGERISDVTLKELNIDRSHWTFRIGVDAESAHVGGVTLYGAGFGNYDQDMMIRLYYT